MRRISNFINNMYFKTAYGINKFRKSERGDTNFVSMILIIAIVVVLAGLFLVFGKEIINTVTTKVKSFVDGL